MWLRPPGRPLWTRAQHQTAALQRDVQVGGAASVHSHCLPAAHGGRCVLRRPSSCHHPVREEHRCHPGHCPPCRQPCSLPLPGCSHACPQPCHDEVLVRPRQVGRSEGGAQKLRRGWTPVSRSVLVTFLLLLCLGAAGWSLGAAVSASVGEDRPALPPLPGPHSNVGPPHTPQAGARLCVCVSGSGPPVPKHTHWGPLRVGSYVTAMRVLTVIEVCVCLWAVLKGVYPSCGCLTLLWVSPHPSPRLVSGSPPWLAGWLLGSTNKHSLCVLLFQLLFWRP